MQHQSNVPFSYREIGEDMDVLRGSLRRLLEQAGQEVAPTEQRRILNLACGRADETGVLADVFGGETEALEIVGADIRAPEIEEARTRWRGEEGSAVETRFHVEDGRRFLEGLSGADGFDVAFLRHQNYWNDPDLWSRMFDGALDKLNDDGLFVITSYFDIEHRQACEALSRLGVELVGHYRNPVSRALPDAPGKSVDRHLAVFRRTRPTGSP